MHILTNSSTVFISEKHILWIHFGENFIDIWGEAYFGPYSSQSFQKQTYLQSINLTYCAMWIDFRNKNVFRSCIMKLKWTVSCFRRFVSRDNISRYFDRFISQRLYYDSEIAWMISSIHRLMAATQILPTRLIIWL
jgi:hypothetical protein